jgi:hypothetical protein
MLKFGISLPVGKTVVERPPAIVSEHSVPRVWSPCVIHCMMADFSTVICDSRPDLPLAHGNICKAPICRFSKF